MQLRMVKHIRTRSQKPQLSLKITSVQNNDDDDNNCDNNHEDTEDQGADVQALGSGGVGLGSSHITHHLPVPRLHRVGIGDEAQAAEVHEECIEQGPDHMVRHRDLSGHVDHSGSDRSRSVRCPQLSHLIFFLDSFIVWGLSPTGSGNEGLRSVVHGAEQKQQRRAKDGELCGSALSPAVSVSQKFPFPEFWLDETGLGSERRGSKKPADQITPGQDVRKDCESGELPGQEPKSELVPRPKPQCL